MARDLAPQAASAADGLEVLGVGDDDRITRRWPWVAVVVAAGLLAVGAAADGPLRDRESAALIDRVASAEGVVTAAEDLVVSRVRYASPLLTSASVEPSLRADLEDVVSEAAAEGEAAVAAARADAAGVTVLPWHSDLADARAAYVSYLDQRLAELRAVAADAGARAGLDGPAGQVQQAAARAALLDAVTDPGAARTLDGLLR